MNSHSKGRESRGSMISSTAKVSAVRKGEAKAFNRSKISWRNRWKSAVNERSDDAFDVRSMAMIARQVAKAHTRDESKRGLIGHALHGVAIDCRQFLGGLNRAARQAALHLDPGGRRAIVRGGERSFEETIRRLLGGNRDGRNPADAGRLGVGQRAR